MVMMMMIVMMMVMMIGDGGGDDVDDDNIDCAAGNENVEFCFFSGRQYTIILY